MRPPLDICRPSTARRFVSKPLQSAKANDKKKISGERPCWRAEWTWHKARKKSQIQVIEPEKMKKTAYLQLRGKRQKRFPSLHVRSTSRRQWWQADFSALSWRHTMQPSLIWFCDPNLDACTEVVKRIQGKVNDHTCRDANTKIERKVDEPKRRKPNDSFSVYPKIRTL